MGIVTKVISAKLTFMSPHLLYLKEEKKTTKNNYQHKKSAMASIFVALVYCRKALKKIFFLL